MPQCTSRQRNRIVTMRSLAVGKVQSFFSPGDLQVIRSISVFLEFYIFILVCVYRAKKIEINFHQHCIKIQDLCTVIDFCRNMLSRLDVLLCATSLSLDALLLFWNVLLGCWTIEWKSELWRQKVVKSCISIFKLIFHGYDALFLSSPTYSPKEKLNVAQMRSQTFFKIFKICRVKNVIFLIFTGLTFLSEI